MATLAEVRKRALIKLGVGNRHQSPTANQDSDMSNAYTELYLKLQEMDQAYWGQTSAVPDEVANEVSLLMALSRADDYGISNERYQRLILGAPSAYITIRSMAVNPHRSVDEPEDF